MSSQVQPISTFPNVYRLISPVVTVDASGGSTEVDANSKFNTNIPLDYYMLVTEVDWIVNELIHPNLGTASVLGISIASFYQLTEALARTIPATTDPVYVDQEAHILEVEVTNASSVGFLQLVTNPARASSFRKHVLANPWATAAQQLNLVANQKNLGSTTITLGKYTVACVIEYQLLKQTPEIRSYLAQRIQIAGQA